MDIKLKARLSAYSRFPQGNIVKPSCDADVVTKEDIDSLFQNDATKNDSVKASSNSQTVSFTDIDSLFK